MFVGVGAARVRDLFEQATQKAPCIVFIDELDALGKSRNSGMMGGHDEREQTLNQLLAEMDGFDARAGLIIMGATNRPEILDPALLRPGRFDRQVLVDRPDKRGREKILQIHAKNVKLGPDVDLRSDRRPHARLRRRGPRERGERGGAPRGAAEQERTSRRSEFEEAIERVVAGLEKKSRRINEREKEIVAFHEAGHALVSWMLPYADRVTKVSIIPRGLGALGYTLQLPLEDRYLLTRSELRDRMAGPDGRARRGGGGLRRAVHRRLERPAARDRPRPDDGPRLRDERRPRPGVARRTSTARASSGSKGLEPRDYSDQTALEIDREVQAMVLEAQERARAVAPTPTATSSTRWPRACSPRRSWRRRRSSGCGGPRWSARARIDGPRAHRGAAGEPEPADRGARGARGLGRCPRRRPATIPGDAE